MALKLKINGSPAQFEQPLRDLAPFTTHGSLSGVRGPRYFLAVGELPAEYRAAATADTVDYLVYSYDTPIAWHDRVTGWQMPVVRYSMTTSKQQGRIRAALSAITA